MHVQVYFYESVFCTFLLVVVLPFILALLYCYRGHLPAIVMSVFTRQVDVHGKSYHRNEVDIYKTLFIASLVWLLYISCVFCLLLKLLIIIYIYPGLHRLFSIFTIILPLHPLSYSSYSPTTIPCKPFYSFTYFSSTRESSTYSIGTTSAYASTHTTPTTIITTSISSFCVHHPPTRVLPTSRQHLTKILANQLNRSLITFT